MKRKKSFLLLEVIIGIALFSLCALPLLRQPFTLTQNSYNYLFEAELFRHAENTHCSFLADLQTNDIPWTSLPKKSSSPHLLASVPCEIRLGNNIKRKFQQSTSCSIKSHKKITAQQEAILYELHVVYVPLDKIPSQNRTYKFNYLLTVVVPTSPEFDI